MLPRASVEWTLWGPQGGIPWTLNSLLALAPLEGKEATGEGKKRRQEREKKLEVPIDPPPVS